MRYLIPIVVFLIPLAVSAQDKKKPGDAMIEKYLNAEADKLSAKFLDGAKTIDEWKQKRPRLYQEYMDMLGLWPIPEKTPLKATVTGTVEAHGVVVENVHFQSKPGLYVTANVYRPRDSAGAKRRPAIVYVCGHSARGRDGCKTAFQDHGFWFANHGYVCIILDTLQLGEIPGVHHGTYGRPWAHLKAYEASGGRKPPDLGPILENRFWWHSIGYSPAAVECWNGIRAIDYLCTRPDVDPDKIGVTGISGGGAATFWIAAADDRVKVAVPVSGMADLEFYVKNKGVNGHCDCMFLYNTYQWDWTTIAALVAPRPMLFANSDKDPIFPMDANRRTYAKLQKIYGMYPPIPPLTKGGSGGVIREYVSPGGHDYRPDLRKAIFHFFNVHLKRMPTAVVEDSAKYTPIEGKKLRVFPGDWPKDAINHRIDEVFIPAAKVKLPEKGKFVEWKKGMVAKLREKSFRFLPNDIPSADEGIHEFGSKGPGADKGLLTFFYFELGAIKDDADFERLVKRYCDPNDGYTATAPRFFDRPKWPEGFRGDLGDYVYGWTRHSPPNYVERSHALLGRTIDQRRVLYLLGSTKFMKDVHAHRLVGRGQTGILAAYAALFEPSIKEVIVIDPPKSHKEGPHFLNVLRVLDIPEALGLLAPTPLTIIGGKDVAFDRTAEIYRLAGAADKLTRK